MYYLTIQSMILLGVFAACTGGVVVTYVVWRRVLRERRKTARRRREALDTLQAAMSSRSLFDVQVENSKGHLSPNFAVPVLPPRPKD